MKRSIRLRHFGARVAFLAALTILSACGGGGDDEEQNLPPQGFTGTATGYEENAFGTDFDASFPISINDGAVTAAGQPAGTYTAPPDPASTACTYEDPSEAGAEQCTARAAGRLILVCNADDSQPEVGVGETPTSGTFTEGNAATIPAAAPPAGLRFDMLNCDGSLNPAQTVLLRNDGTSTLTLTISGTPTDFEFSMADNTTLIDNPAGLLRGDLDSRLGGRSFTYTPAAGGPPQYFFVTYGVRQTAGNPPSAPVLYVQRP